MNLLVIFYLFIPIQVAQAQLKLGFELGRGSYSMHELQQYQHKVVSEVKLIGFDPSIVDAFPDYWNWSVLALLRVSKNNHIGIKVGQSSTGGRVAYSDYSGFIRHDQNIRKWSVGLESERYLTLLAGLQIALGLSMRWNWSSLVLREQININNNEVRDGKSKYRSQGLSGEPHVIIEKRIHKKWSLRTYFGHELDVKATLKSPSNDNKTLTNLNNSKIRTEWRGWRVALQLLHEL